MSRAKVVNVIWLLITAAILSSVYTPAFAAKTVSSQVGAKTKGPLSSNDIYFIRDIARMMGVGLRANQLALKRAAADDVRLLASKTIEEHATMEAELKKIVGLYGLTLDTPEPKITEERFLTKLATLNGDKFEQTYVNFQNDSYSTLLVSFKDQAKSKDNRYLREFAVNTLPIIIGRKRVIDGIAKQKKYR